MQSVTFTLFISHDFLYFIDQENTLDYWYNVHIKKKIIWKFSPSFSLFIFIKNSILTDIIMQKRLVRGKNDFEMQIWKQNIKIIM